MMKLEGIVSERMPYFSEALWSLSQTIANLAWFSVANWVFWVVRAWLPDPTTRSTEPSTHVGQVVG